MGAKMKISFALIAGALSQSTNSSVEQGITELPLASDSLLSASNSSSISDLEVCEKGTSVSVRHITKGQDVTSPSATISAPEREASALRPIAVYVSATTRRALISSLM